METQLAASPRAEAGKTALTAKDESWPPSRPQVPSWIFSLLPLFT